MGVLAVGILVAMGSIPRGHTPIASRWNFNEHLYPVFKDRCGSCHVEGGVAPMSLIDYQSAFPWTQSIREEVLGLRMPPWQAEDGFGDFKNGHALTATEMDMILEWSSGGYPQGPRARATVAESPDEGWTLGEPALVLDVPEAFTLDAGTSETVRYFVLPTGLSEDRVLIAAELKPGARAVVRGGAIFVDTTGTASALDDADTTPGFGDAPDQRFPTAPPVAVWTPGQPSVVNEGAGRLLPTGADIVVRIHYKKTWITEGMDLSDQSQVGLHFADGDAATIESILVSSADIVDGSEVTFRHDLATDITVFALFPEVDIESSELQVEAVRPNGDRIPMLWLREPDRGWPIRFWFITPVALPAGSQIEVRAILDPAAQRLQKASLLGDHTAPIRFSIDYVSGLGPGRPEPVAGNRNAECPDPGHSVEQAVCLHQLGVEDRGTRGPSNGVVSEHDQLVVQYTTRP